MALNIRDFKYKDALARKKRRAFALKLSLSAILGLAVMIGSGYLLLFSKLFEIRNVAVKGLETIDSQTVNAEISSFINQKKFKYFEPNKNIVLFNSANLDQKFRSEYPKLEYVSVSKYFRHDIELNFKEREPLGIWCTTRECNYFDSNGQTWGPAARSSGFLVATVDDQRPSSSYKIDPEFLKPVEKTIYLVRQMNIGIKTISIPPDSFRDFRVYTDKEYYLMLSLDSDVEKQINNFKILLAQRGEDFHVQYVDLRLNDRIYFK